MKRANCLWTALALAAVATCAAQAVDMIILSDFEDLHGWRNLERTTKTVKEGEAAGVWRQMDRRTAISTRAILHDWSDFNALEFWAHLEKPSKATLQLVIQSENNATKGMDYYSTAIPLNWQGWKHFRLAFFRLGVARKPMGWNKIDAIQISASGWGHTPDPNAVLTLDEMRLVRLTMADMLENPSFENVTGSVPDGWQIMPIGKDDAKIEISADAHSGKRAVRVFDQNKKLGVGISQIILAQPGKTYRFACWKKGGPVAMYFKWYDAQGALIGKEKVKVVKNKNPKAYEPFEFVQTAPERTVKLLLWIYSFSTNITDCVVDDLTIEEVRAGNP